jgi:biopolymer transport protein ExbB/TolQ
LAEVAAQPAWLRESRLGKRLFAALEYVHENGHAEDYDEHLAYLRSQEEDNTHAAYTLLRFAIAITPILGFLGTVVHFGTALSGISIESMAETLPVVVGEMGQAFNTTTSALAASMTLMFALFFCERIDNSLLRSVNRTVERELLTRFEVGHAAQSLPAGDVQAGQEVAMQAVRAHLARQIETWSESLGALFHRLDARQDQQLKAWHAALAESERRHKEHDAELAERLRKSLASIDTTLATAASLRDDFQQLLDALHRIGVGEERIGELQAVLASNLETLRQTHQIDQALHGLSAAIHLLTARHRSLPDAAAA